MSSFFRSYRKIGFAGGIISFILPLIVYILTLDPSASWWDCPEYILNASRLEIGHSPGNPSWTLVANVAANVGRLFGQQYIAVAINLTSAIFTSIAISLLFGISFFLIRVAFRGSRVARPIPAALAALSASLMFAWTDSVWFSAVEAEVYALSLMFTAWTLKVMTRYALSPRSLSGKRRLLLVAYLTGLSIGVHELNLLVIPACGLIWLFARRKYPSKGRAWWCLFSSTAILGFILLGIYPGLPILAGKAELFAVNTLDLPFNAGVVIFLCVLVALLISLPLAAQRYSPRLAMPIGVLSFIIIGFGSYILVPLRSAANPPINENAPSDVFSFVSYLKRDQYGSRPLFYGATPYSRPLMKEAIDSNGKASYPEIVRIPKRALYCKALPNAHFSKRNGLLSQEEIAVNKKAVMETDGGKDRYVLKDYSFTPHYTPELDMFFPRLTSHKDFDIKNYESWVDMTKDNMTEVDCAYALDSLGNPVGKMGPDGKRQPVKLLRPTYLQHLRELFAYQFGYMYFRYLLWNFCGRQNDYPSAGEIEHGGVIIGIPTIDDLISGDSDLMPAELGRENPGRNAYYALPLILGIVGIIALQRRRIRRGLAGRRANAVILTLFLMTGIAIVFYLNQDPGEPRERDYSFLGSFLAFALWICAGIAELLNIILNSKVRTLKFGKVIFYMAAGLLLLAMPVMMLAVNYDDHDRSHRSGPADYAANLLNSLDKDAILFLEGDNYTFPVWYAQEVEGVRRDVRVINISYLGTPWYVAQLMQPGEISRPVEMTATASDILFDAFNSVALPKENINGDTISSMDAVESLSMLYSSDDKLAHFASPRLRFAIPGSSDSIILSLPKAFNGAGSIGIRELAALDIIASNGISRRPRSIYWQQGVGKSHYFGFFPYTARSLFAFKLNPQTAGLRNDSSSPGQPYLVDEAMRMVDRLRFGGADKPDMYADPYVGDQITRQRISLIRLAKELTLRQRYKEALRIAEIIADKYPDSVWQYQGFVPHNGVIWQEGIELADIFSVNGKILGDIRSMARGDSLRKAQTERLLKFRKWERSLQPWQRSSLSIETRRILDFSKNNKVH